VQNLQFCHVIIIPIHFLPTQEFGKPLAAVQKFQNLLSSFTSRSLHVHETAGIRPNNIGVAYAISVQRRDGQGPDWLTDLLHGAETFLRG